MSSVKTVAILAVVGFVAASALKSQRYEGIESNRDARSAIDTAVRNTAANFNPNVDLTRRELRNFSVISLLVTRPAIGPFLDSLARDVRNYDVYVKFGEGGSERCITLSLKHIVDEDKWSAMREGSDSCQPIW